MTNTVLVVDDEIEIRQLFAQALSEQGYTVITASDGYEALEILQTVDVLVMYLDLKMDQMHGIELCRRIKEILPEAQVNAITAFSSENSKEECLKAGFDRFYSKPVKLKVLYDATEAAFNHLKNLRLI